MAAYALNWESNKIADLVCTAYKANKEFNTAKLLAKKTGKLLGCIFAIGHPFYTQSMSLIGYSLGCQVIKSTLKTLHYLKATNVVQNVTFLGAAVDLMTIPEKP